MLRVWSNDVGVCVEQLLLIEEQSLLINTIPQKSE